MSNLTRQQVVEKFKGIKLLALDVDGVLTDDAIYFGPDGFEMKKFNISDGLFMVLAMRSAKHFFPSRALPPYPEPYERIIFASEKWEM